MPAKKPDGTAASDAENLHKAGDHGLCAGGSRAPLWKGRLVSGLGLAWHSALKNRHRRGSRTLAS